MATKTAIELWRYISRKGLKPLPKTSVSEWADTYRIISQGNAEPGRWRTDRAEYQREIMNAFTQAGIHRVVVKSAAQIGKSDIMNNVIGRFAHLDPAAIMMIQPTIEMAQDYSKSRIAPMLRDTKVLNNLFFTVKGKEEFGTAKTRDSNNTILSKIFPGGRLVMCGSNSPATLASRPVRVLLADEVDRFAPSAGTEGDPVDLASKRMTTFWNYIAGLFSTPTTEGASRIETEYLAGTQEEWQHECPNCGEYHVLRHTDMDCDFTESRDKNGNVTYVMRSVLWRCPDCGYKFSERQMKDAPQKYVVQNPIALQNGTRSFFINAFSSPWLIWNNIMKEWYEARGDPAREQVVVNTRFGETYRLIGAYDNEMQFLRRREKYDGELPHGVLVLTAAVDVQGNRLEYEVCGWGFGEECWGIRKGILPGNPDQRQVWELLDELLDKPYYFANGNSIKILRTFIDTGGLSTESVYRYCYRNLNKQRIGIKGYANRPGLPLLYKCSKPSKGEYGIPLIILGVNDGKQQVMTRLGIENKGPQYFHFPLDDNIAGQRGYDQLYFKGIISEQRKVSHRGGQIQILWQPVARGIRNEPLDLRVYNLACFKSILPGLNLPKMAETLGVEVPVEAQRKPKPKTTKKNQRAWKTSRTMSLY